MGILLSEHELYKLHQRSKWDGERGDWPRGRPVYDDDG
jgi:hypothetical protein